MGYGIGYDNARTIGGTGYGGGGGYGLRQARSQELDQDFNIEQFEKQFGLQKQQVDTRTAQWEKTFADAQQKYQDTMSKWGFDVGGGTLNERKDYFEDKTGFSQLPEGDPGNNSGFRSRMIGGAGNFVNSKVDLSDPGKALSAASYARSMGENIQNYAPMIQNPYLDIEKRILNSLKGGR